MDLGRRIDGLDIPALGRLMAAGEFDAEQLVELFLLRIKQRDGDLRAVLALDPTARDQARQLDRERADGHVRGPLHGMPILIKDNIETLELPTTAGSLALADNHTRRDAPLVARLRQAGAVILGKTNLSEWANFRSERSSSGWSAMGGQTRNPHDPSRSPCGSSSGSGVAVAAGFAVAAIGTETDGSVVCPGAVNGIVGFKPSVGRISRRGIVPISVTQDTAGPMTRNVTDAAILLAVMQGADADDPATRQTPSLEPLALLAEQPRLDGLRLGLVRHSVRHEGVQAVLDQGLAVLRGAGAVVIDDLAFKSYADFGKDTYDILLIEFRHTLAAYLADVPGQARGWTLEQLIGFNRDHASRELLWFGQEIFEKSAASVGMTDPAYLQALQRVRRQTREDGIDALMAGHDLDALIAPSNGPAWTIDLVNGDHGAGGFSTYPAVSGYPHLTLPMGTLHGLPVGLSVVAGADQDARVLRIAAAIERALAALPEPPRYPPADTGTGKPKD